MYIFIFKNAIRLYDITHIKHINNVTIVLH